MTKQYTFEVINKNTGKVNHSRATAKNPEIARGQIVMACGARYTVMSLPSRVDPAHHSLGEIDCSNFPMADLAWLESEAAKIEA